MDDLDADCASPKNAVDKGYSLAVEHMKREMEEILTNISSNIKIQPNNTDRFYKNRSNPDAPSDADRFSEMLWILCWTRYTALGYQRFTWR